MISAVEQIPVDHSELLFLQKQGDEYSIAIGSNLALDPDSFRQNGTRMRSLSFREDQLPFTLSWELKDATGNILESSEALISSPWNNQKPSKQRLTIQDRESLSIWKTETSDLFEKQILDFGRESDQKILDPIQREEETPYTIPETDFSDLLAGTPSSQSVTIEASAAPSVQPEIIQTTPVQAPASAPVQENTQPASQIQPRASPNPPSVTEKKTEPLKIELASTSPDQIVWTRDFSSLEWSVEHGSILNTRVISRATEKEYGSLDEAALQEPDGIHEVVVQTLDEKSEVQTWKWTVAAQNGTVSWNSGELHALAGWDEKGELSLIRLKKPVEKAQLLQNGQILKDQTVLQGGNLTLALLEADQTLVLMIDGKEVPFELEQDEFNQPAIVLQLKAGRHRIHLQSGKQTLLDREVEIRCPHFPGQGLSILLAGLLRGLMMHERNRRFG